MTPCVCAEVDCDENYFEWSKVNCDINVLSEQVSTK